MRSSGPLAHGDSMLDQPEKTRRISRWGLVRSGEPVRPAELNDALGGRTYSLRGPGGKEVLATGKDRPWLLRYEGGSLSEWPWKKDRAVCITQCSPADISVLFGRMSHWHSSIGLAACGAPCTRDFSFVTLPLTSQSYREQMTESSREANFFGVLCR